MKYFNKALVLALGMGVSTAQAITVFDTGSSGIADNGETMGAAAITGDARHGNSAMHFPPGDSNIIKLTQPVTDLDMSGPYTFMTWVKVLSPGSKGLITLGNCCDPGDGAGREGYTLNIDSSGEMRFWGGSTIGDSNYNEYYTNAALNDGNWHHIAIRVQPGQVDHFFDGVLVDTGTASNIPTAPSNASSDGGNDTTMVPKMGGDVIDGGADADVIVDEIRVYGSALSPSDVVAVMNNGGPQPDRLRYSFEPVNEVPVMMAPGLVLLSALAGLLGYRRLRSN